MHRGPQERTAKVRSGLRSSKPAQEGYGRGALQALVSARETEYGKKASKVLGRVETEDNKQKSQIAVVFREDDVSMTCRGGRHHVLTVEIETHLEQERFDKASTSVIDWETELLTSSLHCWLFNTMSRKVGPMENHRPDMYASLRNAMASVKEAVVRLTEVVEDPLLAEATHIRLSSIQSSLEEAPKVLSRVQNSWSNNFKAKLEYEATAEKAMEVASTLVDMNVATLGNNLEDAYTVVYDTIRPRLSARGLVAEDWKVLRRIFAGCETEVNLEDLEINFVNKNPRYRGTGKRKRDPKVAVDTVVIPGLVAGLPDGFAENLEVQAVVKSRFETCASAIEADFVAAGLGHLDTTQVNSIMVGSVMQQYASDEPFGSM